MGSEIKKIELRNISMSYRTRNSIHKVLDDLSFDIPHNKSLGILGRNGAGKSTLIKILSGVIKPQRGTVNYNGMDVSWPIGKPALQGSLTGANNIKFFCRLLGMPFRETIDFCEDFAELGKYMNMPVNTYSSGMKTRLGFAISMTADYDTLLVDEGFNAGDARFTKKMKALFEEKREKTNMICVSHNGKVIRKFCDYAAILRNGKLEFHDDVNQAIKIYKTL